jgi:hypothetical protein
MRTQSSKATADRRQRNAAIALIAEKAGNGEDDATKGRYGEGRRLLAETALAALFPACEGAVTDCSFACVRVSSEVQDPSGSSN